MRKTIGRRHLVKSDDCDKHSDDDDDDDDGP